MSVRHSKIQKQVLSLYKAFLRASESKPGFEHYVKSEFRFCRNRRNRQRSAVIWSFASKYQHTHKI